MNEVKISELKKENLELKTKLSESERMVDLFMGYEIECSHKLEEAEKELGYYRWYEIHIEQQRSDTFYDMRNGNEYRTRGMCRSQYEREMELKEIEWRNKSNSQILLNKNSTSLRGGEVASMKKKIDINLFNFIQI